MGSIAPIMDPKLKLIFSIVKKIKIGSSHNHISHLGGGGVHPDFFVKLDFEIAVDQQTRAHDQTFEGVSDSGCPPVPAGQPRPYLVNCFQISLTCSQPCFGVLYL